MTAAPTADAAADADALAARCLDLLRRGGHTLATAESLTAGLVAATLADVPGASDVLRGGVVTYATDVKTGVLGVDEAVVTSYGVISAACAQAMAERAQVLFEATWAVSTTGVAGPDRQEDKPVGTVFVAVAGPGGTDVSGLELRGIRHAIRTATVVAALRLLADSAIR